MNPLNSFLFPVPGYRGGEHGNRGTRNTFPGTNFGSTRVPGTFREHSGTPLFPVPGPYIGEHGNGEHA